MVGGMILSGRGKLRRQGVSLVMALFTTVVLLIMSIAFLRLAIGTARHSRTAAYADQALNVANWGIEYTINYMGVGTHWAAGWSGLTPLGTLKAVTKDDYLKDDGSTLRVTVQDADGKPSTPEAVVTWEDTALPNPLPGAKTSLSIGTGSERVLGSVQVNVNPIFQTGQPVSYQLVALARVYTPEGELLASRQVEVTVRKRYPWGSHFILDGRGWDAQGVDLTAESIRDRMKDLILIPQNYIEDGPMSIMGEAGSPIPSTVGNLKILGPFPGGREFRGPVKITTLDNDYGGSPPTSAQRDKMYLGGFFSDQSSRPVPKAEEYLNTDRNGDGVINDAKSDSYPVVGSSERGILYAAATLDLHNASGPVMFSDTDTENTLHRKSGFFKVRNSEVKIRPTVSVGSNYDPKNGHAPQTDDYRPGTPQIEVMLDGDKVRVYKQEDVVHDLDGQGRTLLTTYDLTKGDLPNGVLYVEGGNVVVHELPGSRFHGRLTVVATENPANKPSQVVNGIPLYGSNDTMYNWLAREKFEYEKSQPLPDPPQPGDFKAPPYTRSELESFYNSLPAAEKTRLQAAYNDLISKTPGTDALTNGSEALYYPPPSRVDRDNGNQLVYNPATEREGNIIVASDLKLTDDVDSALGLLAENFVLLNDHTAGSAGASTPYGEDTGTWVNPENPSEQYPNKDVLEVDAILYSFHHSVQFDWDNTGLNLDSIHQSLLAPRDINTNPRLFVSRGSIVSPFMDAEGDNNGKGYYNQKFTFDKRYSTRRPPFMPENQLADLTGTGVDWEYDVINYVDRGAFTTENVVPKN